MENQDQYVKALNLDSELEKEYFTKLYVKSEQQKKLEELLIKEGKEFENIADIACGGGSTSFFVSEIFKQANFTLVDLNKNALDIARQHILNTNFSFHSESIYDLSKLSSNSFDLVICWQTLSWLSDPQLALKNLFDITKSKGKIYISSLFNLDCDVDIYAKVFDHTRISATLGEYFNYNTYSFKTFKGWVDEYISEIEIVKFEPDIDFTYDGRGIGTYTKVSEGKRLQISAGYLMNWYIVVLTKK